MQPAGLGRGRLGRPAGQGAYFDWVVANAIVPPEDDRYTDVRKIDRTTVVEIAAIAERVDATSRPSSTKPTPA